MAQNKIQSLSYAALQALASEMSAAITASPTTYGLTAGQATTLAGAVTTLTTTMAASDAANSAARAATQDKIEARQALSATMSEYMGIIYSKPGIKPSAIADAGLAVHASKGTPITPVTPTNVVATPYATGAVDLSWDRAGNKYGVIFAVETRAETGDWQVVAMLEASKVQLAGFTPGVPAWFRVVAVNRGIRSIPSLETSIYHESASTTLKLAA